MNDKPEHDPRLYAIPDIHGHAKGEHKAFIDERPIPLSARMLFLWFYHACRRGWPRFLMVTDHMNYLTFEDPAAINLVRRALKLAAAGDLYGAAETASVEVGHAAVVSEGLRRGMRYSIGAEVDNDPRSRPDAQNIVDAMKPDGMIRSVHFLTIDHPTHGPNWNWPFDNPEFADVFATVGTERTWELYMAALLDAVERLPGNIVGHFYVPALFGHWPEDATLEAYEDRLVEACESRGMAIEFNTRFLYRDHPDQERAKYLAAHRRLLRKCKDKNVGIAIGSDAHSPKDQGGAFETVLALLDECEINELVFPIAGRLARVALRVERKADGAPAPTPADERRALRKARTGEPSAARGDEPAAADAPADTLDTLDVAPTAKPKARPKRSKARTDGEPAAGAVLNVLGAADIVAEGPLVEVVTEAVVEPIVTLEAAADDAEQENAAALEAADAAEIAADAATGAASAAVEAEPAAAEAEPAAVEAEAAAVEAEPAAVGTEPAAVEPAAAEPADDDATIAETAAAQAAAAEATGSEADATGAEAPALDVIAAPPAGAEAAAVEPAPIEAGRDGSADAVSRETTSVPEPLDAQPVAGDEQPSAAHTESVTSVESVAPGVKSAAEPAQRVAVAEAPAETPAAEPSAEAARAEAAGAEVGARPPLETVETLAVPAAPRARTRGVARTSAKSASPPAIPAAAADPARKSAVKRAAESAKAPASKAKVVAGGAHAATKKAVKPAAKATSKKAGAKKAAGKKAAAKKAAAKRAPAKKAAAKKAAVRAAATKKSAAKKSAAKKGAPKRPAQRRR